VHFSKSFRRDAKKTGIAAIVYIKKDNEAEGIVRIRALTLVINREENNS